MTKVIVTGCAGFIGSWICEKALEKKYTVIGIDNLSSGVNFTPKEVEFYKKDLNDDISNILNNADFIIHAAAHAELRHNWKNREERERLFNNNERATRSLLEQMGNVPIVFLSTASVYGSLSHNKYGEIPLTEENVGSDSVESPYAASKLACEAYISAWSFKRKTPWYVLRLVNQVGKRSYRGVISDFVNMVNKNNHIHAADNGTQKKNWVNVEDTADLTIKLLDGKIPSGIYNVTSDERWSWRDIVDVMRGMGRDFSLSNEECLGGAIGDPLNLYVSGNKLNKYYICKRSVEQAVKDALSNKAENPCL
jgi:UDP-glucose 4-epimerase